MGKRVTLNERRLTKKQVKELIEKEAVFNPELTNDYDNYCIQEFWNIYNLKDGNYLCVFKDSNLSGKGDIWPTEYIEKRIAKRRRESEMPINMRTLSNVGHWFYFSKTKSDFPNKIENLVTELFSKLNISDDFKDYSYNSLDLISQKLNELGEEFVLHNLYDNVIAYCGEILIKRTNGHWSFKTEGYTQAEIRPLIITKVEWVYYDPIMPIWEDFIGVEGFNLRRNFITEMRRHQFDKNYSM